MIPRAAAVLLLLAAPAAALTLESAFESARVPAAARASMEKEAAVARAAAEILYPQLRRCERSVGAGRDAEGRPISGYRGEGPSLVLLTKTHAYYYKEDCDICAEVFQCRLSDGAQSDFKTAHSVGCEDLKAPRSEEGVVFDACGPAPAKPVLSCRASGGVAINGTYDGRTLTLAERGALAPVGAHVLDHRCGSLTPLFDAGTKYDVTPSHKWGQDLLSLPGGAGLDAVRGGPFPAILHVCAYDGDWSASSDVALTCTLSR